MKKMFVAAVVAVTALLGSATSANASFALRISSGASTVIVSDENLAITPSATNPDGSLGVPGLLTYSGTVGAFTINVTTGLGPPIQANNDSHHASIHLNNVSVTTSTGGTLSLELSYTGFTLASSSAGIQLNSTMGGITGGTVEAWQVLDLDNGLFAPTASGEAVTHHGPFTATTGPAAFSGNQQAVTGTPYSSTPFSITERVVISHTGAATTSFDIDSVAVVPAPPSVIMCLTGLPVLMGGWWYRRKAVRGLIA